MDYASAVDHLYGLGLELAPPVAADPTAPPPPRRKFELEHMRILARALGDPQKAVPSILIAGTNGKGSTAATLASILTAAGYRTGLYTSPHLVRVNERIQIAHPVLPGEYGSASVHGTEGRLALREIADEDFARLYFRVDDAARELVGTGALPWHPSFFEVLTALAFCFFAEQQAEVMVLEVGLGGRLDATNIVEPLISVVTDIALDHQEYLGDTIAEITREKCGILRPHGVLVTLPQLAEANQAIGEVAMALEVRGVNAAEYLPPAVRNGAEHSSANRYTIQLEPEGVIEVDSPLPGDHQRRNLALAIATAITLRESGFEVANGEIEAGIHETRWPGRLELLRLEDGQEILFDVAHNPAGAWTLRSALSHLPYLPADRPRTLIFSCLRDKSLEEMSRILFPLFDSSVGGDPLRGHDHIVLAPIGNPRAAAVEDLLAAAHALDVPAHAAPHLAGALAQARQVTPAGGLIVATGSVYLVGELRQLVVEA